MANCKKSCSGCSCDDKPKEKSTGSSAGLMDNYTFANRPNGSKSKSSLGSLYPPKHEKEEAKYPVKRVLILRGIHGSGKSRLAATYKNASVIVIDLT